MTGPGWWLSPTGDIATVATTHVAAIIDDPDLFGFTKDQVLDAYDRHDEQLYSEGRAREELILDAVRRGWIRIRRYRQYYSVTTRQLDEDTTDRLREWATRLLDGGIDGYREQDRYADLVVTCIVTEEIIRISLDDLLSDPVREAAPVVAPRPNGTPEVLPPVPRVRQ